MIHELAPPKDKLVRILFAHVQNKDVVQIPMRAIVAPRLSELKQGKSGLLS
jgi:hypothetical protein